MAWGLVAAAWLGVLGGGAVDLEVIAWKMTALNRLTDMCSRSLSPLLPSSPTIVPYLLLGVVWGLGWLAARDWRSLLVPD